MIYCCQFILNLVHIFSDYSVILSKLCSTYLANTFQSAPLNRVKLNITYDPIIFTFYPVEFVFLRLESFISIRNNVSFKICLKSYYLPCSIHVERSHASS